MTATYRIIEGGHPGYYIAADNRDGSVCLRNSDPAWVYNFPGHRLHGKPIEFARFPKSQLIPATSPRAGASGVELALSVAPTPSGADSPPADSSDRKAGGGSIPALPSAGGGHRGARTTDPQTSLDAAMSVTDPARRTVYAAILNSIREHGPLTDWQLAKYVSLRVGLAIIPTSVGVRRGEMRNMGLLADSGHRGPTETGPYRGIRWALTPAGEAAA